MKTHDIAVKVHPGSSQVTIPDREHHIDSGDRVIWNLSWDSAPSGDTLEIELRGSVLSGTARIESTIAPVGAPKGERLYYSFSLNTRTGKKKLGYRDPASPLIPPPETDPCLVLDTNGPPPGGGGGTGHCPHGPKDPPGQDGETPDHHGGRRSREG